MEEAEVEDYRTHYATSGQVVDLWATLKDLRDELQAMSARLQALEASGKPSVDAVLSAHASVGRTFSGRSFEGNGL